MPNQIAKEIATPVTAPADFVAGQKVPPPRFTALWIAVGLICLCFCLPLYQLVRYALHRELYSHILLIPCISIYLMWLKRRQLPSTDSPAVGRALIPFVAGLALLGGYLLARRSGWEPATNDYFACILLSFLCFLLAAGLACLGAKTMRAVAFPVAFLLFILPFPVFIQTWINASLQESSAQMACAFIKLSGLPVLREGIVLRLPGLTLEVGPGCSGLHATLILFITSLLAGHLLLNGFWRRAVLVLAVIPLAIVRNGIRILTLAQLCVRVSHDVLDSWFHHHGGILFFLASLIPFFWLLNYLRKSESKPQVPQ